MAFRLDEVGATAVKDHGAGGGRMIDTKKIWKIVLGNKIHVEGIVENQPGQLLSYSLFLFTI